MPRPVVIAIAILLMAVVTAVLYGWGLFKQQNQSRDLTRMLYAKGAERVKKYLQKHDTISTAQMEQLVKGMKASLFYSRNKAVVADPKEYVRNLTAYMIEYHLLEERRSEGKIIYAKPQTERK